MLSPQALFRLIVARRLPQVTPDNGPQNEVNARGGRYGEQYVLSPWPNDQILADEGSYITAGLAPGATALQHGILAAFDATKACIAFQNTEAANFDGGKRCYLRRLRFLVVTPPTSGTSLRFATVLDPNSRQPTTVVNLGGTPATATAYKPVPVNTSLDVGSTPVGAAYFPLSTAGGLPPAVPGASQNARVLVGNGHLRGQIPVAQDEYVIQFGASDHPGGSLVTAAPAGASRVVTAHPPVVVPPQGWFLFHLWAPGNITAGIAFDGLEMDWAER